MKLLITGGHLTPALAVIDALPKEIEVIFVGRKYNLDSEKTLSLEYKELQKRNIRFHSLHTGKFTRLLNLDLFVNLLKIPFGLIQSMNILLEEKPDCILSFGGYISLPICTVAALMNKTIYTHEQTAYPGMANRIIGLIAKKIFISFPDTHHYFPKTKTILSGNPVRKTIFSVIHKPFEIIKDKPVIYITGGSLGSHSINEHVSHILPKLLNHYIVIHQAGSVKKYGDWEMLQKIQTSLPEQHRKNYFLTEHFSEDELGYVYSISDVVVGRAGANTFFELLSLEKPAVFIPLPWAAHAEQQKHAELFHTCGTGEIFNQADKSIHLFSLIEKVLSKIEYYKKNFVKLHYLFVSDATSIIINTIVKR